MPSPITSHSRRALSAMLEAAMKAVRPSSPSASFIAQSRSYMVTSISTTGRLRSLLSMAAVSPREMTTS